MATKKNAAPKIATKVAAGFPAKSAPSKSVEFDEAKHMEREAAKAAKAKKPTRAKKAVASPVEVAGKALAAASTKPMRAKAATKPARPPAVLAKSGKLLGADPKGVPGTKVKRTVAVPENGLSGVPVHDAYDVASLAKILGDFPRGSTFVPGKLIEIYNLRGRLIAEVRKTTKPAKGAKK